MTDIQVENIAGKVNIVLSASSIDLFQLCKARFNYRTNLKRVLPIIQKSKSLDLGTLAHVGLEHYYKDMQKGIHYSDRMQHALMKVREAASDPELSNAESEDIDLILRTVEQSCDYWRAEDEQMEILEVEAPFDYILFEDETIRIIISGKIDLLVNIVGVGRSASYTNLPFDHKTSKREFPIYRLSNQFINYCAATGSNYLIVNKLGLQKTLKPEEKYKRVPLSYDPLIIQQWKDNIVRMVLSEYLECVASGSWSMNFTSCYKFNRLCEYYEVCDSSGEDAKAFKLEANYVEAKPYNKYKESEE